MIPEGWDDATLGDLVKLQRGHDLPSQNRIDGEVKVIGGGGPNGFHNVARANAPGIVIGRSGSGIGNAWWSDEDFWPLNTGMYVTDYLGNDPRFCFLWLDWIDFTSHNSGGAQPSLNRNFIYPIPLPIPPLPEQRKIADILSTWDQAIEKTEALLSNARTQKRALMQQLLTGKRRFPAFEGQAWTSGKLIDHFDFINGRAFKPDDWGEVGFPIIRIQNLTGSTDSINYFDGEVDEKHTIRNGDFLLSWSATLDTFIWDGPVAVLNQHIFKVVPQSDTLKMFGFHLITHEIGKLVSKVHGTSMKHITKKDLAKIESFFPSLAEQEKITEALDDAEHFVSDTQADLTKLRTEKKALMQQLLTGKRRVSV